VSGGFDPPSAPGSNPPPPLYPPPPPPGYSPAVAPPPAVAYAQPAAPPDSKATASLALGITGLALLVTSTGLLVPIALPCSILAWVFGRNREGMGKAGRICGIVGVALGVLALLLWTAVIVAAATSD
jgi:hypothetical protein